MDTPRPLGASFDFVSYEQAPLFISVAAVKAIKGLHCDEQKRSRFLFIETKNAAEEISLLSIQQFVGRTSYMT